MTVVRVPVAAAAAFACALVASAGFAGSPYGICAHLHIADAKTRAASLARMAEAGIGWFRTDFAWAGIERRPGEYDFTVYDAMMAEAKERGIRVLPILDYDNPRVYPDFAWQHPREWCAFAAAVVERYRADLEAVEVWNEPNIPFWKPKPDAAQYAQFLKLTFAAIRRVAPEVRVLMGGTAALEREFIDRLYAEGAGECMDVLNIHPYTHPHAPEEGLVPYLEYARKAVADHGGRQTIWITEVGWPTHTPALSAPSVIRAALATARPGRTRWNAVFADACATGSEPNASFPRAIEAALQGLMKVEACDPEQTRRRLAAGGVDAVFFPFNERYPLDAADAVRDFVRKGGVLLQFGGIPMYRWVADRGGRCEVGRDGSPEAERDRRRFGIGYDAWWTNPAVPETAQVYPTEGAVAAGLKAEPTGFRCGRFFTRKFLRPGDEMVPLLVGKDRNGGELVGACVYRLDGEGGGCVAVCGLPVAESGLVATEALQAKYYARTLGIATAAGVERTFTYNLQAWEEDPYYSEHHFGICHRDFSPKPAFASYATFTRMRPAGSVNAPGPWHDGKCADFFPQWMRPDGTKAGMVWTVGLPAERRFAFDSPKVEFSDISGRPLRPPADDAGGFRLPVSDSPVYFKGGWIAR